MKRDIFKHYEIASDIVGLILNIACLCAMVYVSFIWLHHWANGPQGFWAFVGVFIGIIVVQAVLQGVCIYILNGLFAVGALQKARIKMAESNATFLQALFRMKKRLLKLHSYDENLDRDEYLKELKKLRIQAKLIRKLKTSRAHLYFTGERILSLVDDLDLLIIKQYAARRINGELLNFNDTELEIFINEGLQKLHEKISKENES